MSGEGSAAELALLTHIKIALLAGVGVWTLAASATPWVLQRAFSKRGLDLIWVRVSKAGAGSDRVQAGIRTARAHRSAPCTRAPFAC